MATKKQAGSAKSTRDSKAQYLGIKCHDGEVITAGSIILRQRGMEYLAGTNVGVGKDHTLFALTPGKVSYKTKRKFSFNGTTKRKSIVNVDA